MKIKIIRQNKHRFDLVHLFLYLKSVFFVGMLVGCESTNELDGVCVIEEFSYTKHCTEKDLYPSCDLPENRLIAAELNAKSRTKMPNYMADLFDRYSESPFVLWSQNIGENCRFYIKVNVVKVGEIRPGVYGDTRETNFWMVDVDKKTLSHLILRRLAD